MRPLWWTRRPALACALVGLAVGLGSPAVAQVPPLVPDGSPPGRVLHRADWLLLEPLSVEDLLRLLSGIGVGRSGGLGSPEALELAGSTNGRVQLVVDGVDVSEPDLAWPRIIPIQVGMIDSIEVVQTTDPARIAIWTRRNDGPAPQVDIDLTRADLGTRTRRVQMFTPPRALDVVLCYEELLRSGDDFRPGPIESSEADLGQYSGRSLLARIGMNRGDDIVHLEYYELLEESHGSVASQTDATHVDHARARLLWNRPLGSGHVFMDFGHQAWRRRMRVESVDSDPTDARTHAAADIALPALGAWNPWIRLRHATITGDVTLPTPRHVSFGEQRVEVEASRIGRIRLDLWGGADRDGRVGTTWSTRGRLTYVHAGTDLGADVGRGITWGGWNEADTTLVRTGRYGSVHARWRGPVWGFELEGFGKDMDGGGSTSLLVPGAGPGPSRVGGLTLRGSRTKARGSWLYETRVGMTWTPYIRGDDAGRPTVDTRIAARISRRFRNGDLVVSVLTTWAFDTRREFAAGSIPPSALGDVALDLQFLQHLAFCGGLRNLTDANIATYPGVELPSRLPWIGVRTRLFD
jgi:hypothetical protein